MTEGHRPDHPTSSAPEECLLHASAVAVSRRGVLILGDAGTGKSALALQLLALGGTLISDDRTAVYTTHGGRLMADAPDRLRGLIEARGVGLLAAAPAGPTPLVLAVDLAIAETERLPPVRQWSALGVTLPLLHKVERAYFAAAIMQYLRGGRPNRP